MNCSIAGVNQSTCFFLHFLKMNGAYAIKQSFTLEVSSDNKYTCNAVFPLVITNIALMPTGDDKAVVLHAEITSEEGDKKKIIVCTLHPKHCMQYSTNLVYSAGETVEFSLSADGTCKCDVCLFKWRFVRRYILFCISIGLSMVRLLLVSWICCWVHAICHVHIVYLLMVRQGKDQVRKGIRIHLWIRTRRGHGLRHG